MEQIEKVIDCLKQARKHLIDAKKMCEGHIFLNGYEIELSGDILDLSNLITEMGGNND